MMNRTIVTKILALSLTILPLPSLASVAIVKEHQLPASCQEIGKFEARAGYGKSMMGEKIALARAKKKAQAAGANYAVILELNRGPSDQNGYCLLKGFYCP